MNKDGEKKAEIIFVTDDRSEPAFKNNLSKMPWFAIPYDDEHRKSSLKIKYGICEIPTLIVISANDCSVVTYDGRDQV